MHSAIYRGWVRHRRYRPRPHEFRYQLFQVYLDLDEIDQFVALSRWFSRERANLASYRRAEYLDGENGDLKNAVHACVRAAGHPVPAGPVRLLTHLRYFGYVFNPVSFYYCFEADGVTLHTIVAEITNTPWKERHQYVLPLSADQRASGRGDFNFAKAFHVSPFIGMQRQYRWRFTAPGKRHVIHMNVTHDEDNEFDATLVLRRQPATRQQLNRCLWNYPLMCSKVAAAIHWQALRLWLKRTPVIDHPKHELKKSKPL